MKCPYCNNEDTKVIDSRPTEDGHAIRRRRGCDFCGRRFTTYEKAEASIVMIVKKDGRREAFDRDKVFGGILKACEKRPVSVSEIEAMADRIERGLNNLMEKEVKSDFIGELVMNELRDVDQVAYIRFASVYRQFTDVETFAEEIDKLMKKSRTGVYGGDKGSVKGKAPAKESGHVRIAVDGPSGAGKSTIAKKLAEKLGVQYVDTGAMYRAIGYKMLKSGVTEKEKKKLAKLLAETSVDWKNGKVILDGKDLGSKIRTPEVSEMASKCSAIKEVREKLVEEQRNIASRMSVVMDGRDIGTNVMPDAEVKIYLDAAPEERARRRWLELKEKDPKLTMEEVLKDINERDKRDMTRKINPLRKADDAHLIDSTNMSIDEVVEAACRIVENR